MGQIFAPLLAFEVPGLSGSVVAPDLPLGERGLYDAPRWEGHPWFSVYESEDLQVSFGGQRMRTFLEDWYFRIHFLPVALTLGTFSSQIVRSVQAWNAYPQAQNLTAVSLVDSESSGVIYAAPETPYAFSAFEVRPVTFVALQRGPDAISEVATFSFAVIGDRDLSVTGFRVQPPQPVLWPYKPNWAQAWSVQREWRTDIIVSRDGTEQRRALRVQPRRTQTLTNVVRPTELKDFRTLISSKSRGLFVLPDYTTRVSVVGDAPDGVTASVDSTPWWFEVDKYVVFENGVFRSARLIREITGSTISFWEDDGIEWKSGTRVYPGLLCERQDELQSSRLTTTVNTLSTVLAVVPGSEPQEDYGVPEIVFDGREVAPFRHNWAGPQSLTFLRPSELVDFGFGVRSRFYLEKLPKQRLQVQAVLKSSAQAANLRKFVGRMAGRQGEFYFTLGEKDLIPQFDLLPNPDTQFMRTEGSADFSAYLDDTSLHAIEVGLTSGTIIRRVVESIEFVTDELGESTQFNVRGRWPSTILTTQVRRVSILALWRLSSDVYEETWSTDGVCSVQLQIETLARAEADEL